MSAGPSDVSVIFSTFQQPEWLRKALCGFASQTQTDFEIVVADDGSGEETAQVIRSARKRAGLRIEHIWQADSGFRKCRVLNKAIVRARGDYLIFTDGDCIPHPEFVARHLELAEPGRFLSGGLLRLPLGLSHNIQPDDISSGRAFSASWLSGLGMAGHLQAAQARRGPRLRSATGPRFPGHRRLERAQRFRLEVGHPSGERV